MTVKGHIKNNEGNLIEKDKSRGVAGFFVLLRMGKIFKLMTQCS